MGTLQRCAKRVSAGPLSHFLALHDTPLAEVSFIRHRYMAQVSFLIILEPLGSSSYCQSQWCKPKRNSTALSLTVKNVMVCILDCYQTTASKNHNFPFMADHQKDIDPMDAHVILKELLT